MHPHAVRAATLEGRPQKINSRGTAGSRFDGNNSCKRHVFDKQCLMHFGTSTALSIVSSSSSTYDALQTEIDDDNPQLQSVDTPTQRMQFVHCFPHVALSRHRNRKGLT